MGAGELDVEWPDAAVLSERQGLQGSVEGAPGLRHLPLVDEELAVVQPDTRHLRTRERPVVSWLEHGLPLPHLVHEDEGSLKSVVNLIVSGISHTLAPNLLPAQLQVVVPQLVAAQATTDETQ